VKCKLCENEISTERLEILPLTKVCVRCATMIEQATKPKPRSLPPSTSVYQVSSWTDACSRPAIRTAVEYTNIRVVTSERKVAKTPKAIKMVILD